MVHKVDLQAGARTCSQETRDSLSHGVLPYGASLVGAGVREGSLLHRSPPSSCESPSFQSRRLNAQTSNCLRFDTSTSPKACIRGTVRGIANERDLASSGHGLPPREWNCTTRRRVWCGYPQVTLSETLFPSIECSWKDKGTFCVT